MSLYLKVVYIINMCALFENRPGCCIRKFWPQIGAHGLQIRGIGVTVQGLENFRSINYKVYALGKMLERIFSKLRYSFIKEKSMYPQFRLSSLLLIDVALPSFKGTTAYAPPPLNLVKLALTAFPADPRNDDLTLLLPPWVDGFDYYCL